MIVTSVFLLHKIQFRTATTPIHLCKKLFINEESEDVNRRSPKTPGAGPFVSEYRDLSMSLTKNIVQIVCGSKRAKELKLKVALWGFFQHCGRSAYCVFLPPTSSRIHLQRRHASYRCARTLQAKAGTTTNEFY